MNLKMSSFLPPFSLHCLLSSTYSLLQLINHTVRHAVGGAPLDERSDRRTPDNTQHSKTQIVMPSAGFEPAIPASELPQTHASEQPEMKNTNRCVNLNSR